MNNLRASITGLWIALSVAGCLSGSSTTEPPQGGSGGSTDHGGAGGNVGGGATGNPNGGSTGTANGGSTGTPSGGSTGSPNGGSTAPLGGGSAGKSTGGSGGTAGGGSTVAPSGGSAGAASGGAAGSSAGGAAGSPGGSSGGKGGATGGGGSQAGGNTGTGGSTTSGSGGSTVVLPSFVTSAQNSYWQTGTVTTVTSGNADITVTDTTAYQTWDGFGGTFNEIGWNVLSMLSPTDRDRAMKLLFDPNEGAGFVFGRIPIGASDYAIDRYSLNETANDYTMTSFSLDRDKQKLIPYIKAALAINPNLRLWASPWTPPTWMKTGSYTTDGKTGWDGGNMKDDAQILQAYALYLAKFVEEYGKEAIKIETVHPQNEPGYATRYPSCLWTIALMKKFIGTYLGPTFADRKLTATIYLGTMSNAEAGKDGDMVNSIIADATAMKYVKGFGLQWNMLPIVTGIVSKNLPIVQTEHKCGNYPWEPEGLPKFNADKAQNDYPYAVESWGYLRDWIKVGTTGVNSYSAWNMVLDTAGKNIDTTRPWPQNALLTVDTTAKTLTVTPVYYVFRHFSQFIAAGAKRVATSGSSPDALAFKNPDGSIVTVMYNSGSSAKTTTLAVGGTKVQFSIPAGGFATVKR